MTKKSSARLQRDAYKNNNTAWDDITGIYQNTFALLAEVSNQISSFFSIEGVEAFIPAAERTKTITVRNSLASDLAVFSADLDKIHAGHAGKTGGLKEDDNILQIIELSEAYTNFSTRFEAIVTPSYQYLLTIMAAIETNARRIRDAEAAVTAVTDTSVITDVEIKAETLSTAEPIAIVNPV